MTLYEGLLKRCHLFLHKRELAMPETKAIVSFSFDDFPQSAYRTGGEILTHYGVHGTYYTSLGLMDATNDLGRHFAAQDLHDLLADGHELASHSFSHADCRSIPLKMYEEDVMRNQAEIDKLLPGVSLQNFAYPSGAVTLAAKRAMGQHFVSCRGIYGGINARRADLDLLRANSFCRRDINLHDAHRLIATNAGVKGWLIFFTHDVCDHPSPWGCTPQDFEAVVKYAAESSSEIMTIHQALTWIQQGA